MIIISSTSSSSSSSSGGGGVINIRILIVLPKAKLERPGLIRKVKSSVSLLEDRTGVADAWADAWEFQDWP